MSATKAFAKRYFTDVLLLCNNYSLETFVKICQHPVFGPSIQRVQLSCARCDEQNFCEVVDDIKNKCSGPGQFVENIQSLYDRCESGEDSCDDHESALLDQAFSHLARADRSFILAVSTNEDKALGSRKIWTANEYSELWWADPFGALNLLLHAAQKSDCTVRKIEIEAGFDCNRNLSNYIIDYRKGWNIGSSLSELTFDLSKIPADRPYYMDIEGATDLMESLLSQAAHLKVLRVRANKFTGDDNELKSLAQAVLNVPLEELHLTDVSMPQNVMTDLLKNLGPTLCRLELANCDITGSWKQILLSIQQHTLKLEQLRISGTRRFWLEGVAAFKGITNVRSGVERLLQTREEMFQDKESEPDFDYTSYLESDSDDSSRVDY